MKLIMPVKEKESNELIDGFMENSMFCIYDAVTRAKSYLSMHDITPKAGNLSLALKKAGIKGLVVNSLEVVQMGLFTESGFVVLKAANKSVDDSIGAFNMRLLNPMGYQLAPEMSGCSSGSYSSCTTCS